ncbi:MAG: chalcone isomerase family protein [Acidobacteriota bacterium]
MSGTPATTKPFRAGMIASALALCLTLPSFAAELGGVTLPDQVNIDGDSLVLNGMGLRKKAIIKVYVGGLYLPAKQSDGAAILANDSSRHMVMHFLFTVPADRLSDAWSEGLENNTPGASAGVREAFGKLNGWMVEMKKGEQMTFSYRPGSGTTVSVKGEVKGTLKGREFADALFACWIGKEPPSSGFKKGLLGSR